MHLTMVVVADASFGWSRFRSEPFLSRFLENFENSQKPAQKRLRNGFSARNASDTFRRSRTKSSFPIAMASQLLQYGCCNFVGVLNIAHRPICALNISQKKYLWFVGRWPWAPVDSSKFPYGARKNETGRNSVSTIIWVLGVVGAANYTP